MDQMLFDITDVPEAQEGDVITLIGTDGARSIQLADCTGMLDTITYELACRMRVRLPRIYTRHRISRGSPKEHARCDRSDYFAARSIPFTMGIC